MAHKTLSREDDASQRTREGVVPQLFVLIECDRLAAASSRHALAGVERVQIGRGERRCATRDGASLSIEVPDGRMSLGHAKLVRVDGKWIVEDAGSKNGLVVEGERRRRLTLHDGSVFELGHTVFLYRELALPPDAAPDEDRDGATAALQTFVPALARTFADLAAVAGTSAAVLIQGETGTGKELVARAAHALGGRAGRFVAVNCGALPETLVESELYGHKKGAFSGADQDRPGLVRSADGGTLFLDEIADLPLASQAALLRVLQEREVTPVGGTHPIAVDLHIVAATHHDLPACIERGTFRRDLFARLAAFIVRLPPLRERREDLGLILATLLPRIAGRDVRISCAAARRLVEHDWPLNVRELENSLTVAAALARGGQIKIEHLTDGLRLDEQPAVPTQTLSDEDQARRDELVGLLHQHAGNVSAIARATGKARTQVHRWLRRFRLDPESFR